MNTIELSKLSVDSNGKLWICLTYEDVIDYSEVIGVRKYGELINFDVI